MAYKYDYLTFEEIFEDAEDFYTAYPSEYSEFTEFDDTHKELTLIYTLLNARYATSKTFMDEERFKARCMSLVFQFGPKFIKDVKIQKRLRTLTENEMVSGAAQKSLSGYNPSTDISGNTDTEISTVNQQNLLKYTKGILDGYTNLYILLKTDVTATFLQKFKSLFASVIDTDDIEEDE